MAKILVLVHGLGGTINKTWGKFPDLLQKDPELDFNIVQYGYESPHPLSWKFWSRGTSILNISNGLLTDIKYNCDLENDEIILVGHSLGGIVIKKMLLRIKTLDLQHNITKVCFVDVPHDGSGYANVGKYISFRNKHLKELCRDSSQLDDLNDQWVDSGLNNKFEILSIIAANDDIVSSSSSKSIFRNHPVETINNVNHETIAKPEDRNSSAYKVLKRFAVQKSTVNRYKNSASRDLDDWKRIERRNHSYSYVSDEKRQSDLDSAVKAIDSKQAIIRLTGASGLGKTRLLMEAIEQSETIDEDCILVFDASGYEKEIRESVRKAVDENAYGLIIIENCRVDLHEDLVSEIKKIKCELRIVTNGYSHESVNDSIHIQLAPLSDETIKELLSPILTNLEGSDLERIAKFVQGYPLMATLIAEQYLSDGMLLGAISESSIVRKLIRGDDGINEDEKDMLSACSLFDGFGVEQGEARKEAKFIAEQVANLTLALFDKVIHKFTKRQLINRASRFARVVPKPLALSLAGDWWEETSYDQQKQLIDNLPETLMDSFCTQAKYLDRQSNVQRFTEKLFSYKSPFGQAEVLTSSKGSRLFRALTEVNPETTSSALYRTLKDLTNEEIKNINSDARRNFVWGLEKLCFHSHIFEEASWCLLLLASAETESFSNNATGIFSQLFRIYLSGTGAKPEDRYNILQKALKLNQFEVDMVLLEALEEAVDTYGGSRAIGAEYQGTKAPLLEWQPKKWQEIFDYWQEIFDFAISMIDRGESQKLKVLEIIGNSIRGLVANGRLKMLDDAIKKVVKANGRYWPAALGSIKNTLEYDSKGLNEESISALDSWLSLLNPGDGTIEEKLKIVVVNPPWEHHKEEDGSLTDLAAKNAKKLAKSVAKDIDSLFPYIHLLLKGNQNQSFVFGHQIALELKVDDTARIIDLCFENLIKSKSRNIRFVLGVYSGVFDKYPEKWEKLVNKIFENEEYKVFYPEIVCTGDIHENHLKKLLGLIHKGVISPNSVNSLSYGRSTESIDPDTIGNFCVSLSEIGNEGAWIGLNIIFMYTYSNKEAIKKIREIIKLVVTKIVFEKDSKKNTTDTYHWYQMALTLLKQHDEEFALALGKQILLSCKKGVNYGDLWHYIKPLLTVLMQQYYDILWPIYGEAIVQAEGMERFYLKNLLDKENRSSRQKESVLSGIPIKILISWCHQHPNIGPAFIARCAGIYEIVEEEKKPSELFIQFLESFGDDESVGSAFASSIYPRSWSGSLVPYLEKDRAALTPLLGHKNGNVNRWVKRLIKNINSQIDSECRRDSEQNFR